MVVSASPLTWIVRAVWLSLPLTLGGLLSDALTQRSAAVATTTSVLAWTTWAAVLLASMVLQPVALVALRVLSPLAVLAGALAALDGPPGPWGWVGLASAAAVAVAAMSAEVGIEFINGAPYGDERRFPLRPPVALLAGPVPIVWCLLALPAPAGVLLLASGRWLPGALLVAMGAATAWWGWRVLSRLVRRWCVFVPAGITLVDDMALADPTLMRREDIVRLGPAPVDTDALDLSAGAAGLILQVDLAARGSVVPAAPRGGVTEAVETSAVLFAPSRPGALLAHAADRGIAVGV